MTAPGLVLAALAAGYALLFGGAVEDSHWRVCQAVIGLAAIAACLLSKPDQPARHLDRRAAWLFAGFFLYCLLLVIPLPEAAVRLISPERARLSAALSIAGPAPAWITLSVQPAASAAILMRWISAAVLFLVIRAAVTRLGGGSWWPVAPLVLLAVFEALTGFAQLGFGAAVQGTSGNRNHFAAALNLALPFAIAAGVSRAFLPGLAGAALLAAASTASLSRMGFAVALLCSAMTFWKVLRSRFHLATVALLLAGLLPAAFALAPGSLIERFAGGDDRLTLWRESLELVRAYPISGCGPGTYEVAFQRFKQIAPGRTADYAHNDFLQLLAELGLTGFALLAAAFFFLLRPLGHHPRRWFGGACAASLLGAAFHSLTDYPLYIPANLLLFSWVLGVSSVGPTVRKADILRREA